MSQETLEALNLDFPEAINYFRSKSNVFTSRSGELSQQEHDYSFTVAGINSATVLQLIRSEVDSFITEGRSIQDFRRNFNSIMSSNGWPIDKNNVGWRAKLIANENLRHAYAAGRWEQLNDPDLLKIRPYFQWDANNSDQSRHEHSAIDGLILPADDPFWNSMRPPAGYGCKCFLVSLTEEQARKRRKPIYLSTWKIKNSNGVIVTLPRGVQPGFEPAKNIETQRARSLGSQINRGPTISLLLLLASGLYIASRSNAQVEIPESISVQDQSNLINEVLDKSYNILWHLIQQKKRIQDLEQEQALIDQELLETKNPAETYIVNIRNNDDIELSQVEESILDQVSERLRELVGDDDLQEPEKLENVRDLLNTFVTSLIDRNPEKRADLEEQLELLNEALNETIELQIGLEVSGEEITPENAEKIEKIGQRVFDLLANNGVFGLAVLLTKAALTALTVYLKFRSVTSKFNRVKKIKSTATNVLNEINEELAEEVEVEVEEDTESEILDSDLSLGFQPSTPENTIDVEAISVLDNEINNAHQSRRTSLLNDLQFLAEKYGIDPERYPSLNVLISKYEKDPFVIKNLIEAFKNDAETLIKEYADLLNIEKALVRSNKGVQTESLSFLLESGNLTQERLDEIRRAYPILTESEAAALIDFTLNGYKDINYFLTTGTAFPSSRALPQKIVEELTEDLGLAVEKIQIYNQARRRSLTRFELQPEEAVKFYEDNIGEIIYFNGFFSSTALREGGLSEGLFGFFDTSNTVFQILGTGVHIEAIVDDLTQQVIIPPGKYRVVSVIKRDYRASGELSKVMNVIQLEQINRLPIRGFSINGFEINTASVEDLAKNTPLNRGQIKAIKQYIQTKGPIDSLDRLIELAKDKKNKFKIGEKTIIKLLETQGSELIINGVDLNFASVEDIVKLTPLTKKQAQAIKKFVEQRGRPIASFDELVILAKDKKNKLFIGDKTLEKLETDALIINRIRIRSAVELLPSLQQARGINRQKAAIAVFEEIKRNGRFKNRLDMLRRMKGKGVGPKTVDILIEAGILSVIVPEQGITQGITQQQQLGEF